MSWKMVFSRCYFFITTILFVTEVLIAKYAHDDFIRPYVGDVLVVILIYCFVRTFLNTAVFTTAFCVLFFAYGIETLQYFQIVKLIGLQDSKLANVIIGNYFTWVDILSYTIGFMIILAAENVPLKRA